MPYNPAFPALSVYDTVSMFDAVYLGLRNNTFNVVIEAKVDHVEDSMATQGGGKSLVEPPQPFDSYYLTCNSES